MAVSKKVYVDDYAMFWLLDDVLIPLLLKREYDILGDMYRACQTVSEWDAASVTVIELICRLERKSCEM